MVRPGFPLNRSKFKNTYDFALVNDKSRNRKGTYDHKHALSVVPASNLLHWYYSFNDAVYSKKQVLRSND